MMLPAVAALVAAASFTPASRTPVARSPGQEPAGTAPSAVPAVSRMTVDIWPEYDDPRVLVMYSGKVDPSVKTPAAFSLAVPAGAQIHMAGGVDARGGHVHAQYETRQREDGLMDVSYTLEVPDFYMEFYYDPFSGDDERRFTYPVVAPSTVDSLVVSVQQPLRAEDFEVTPFTEQVVQDGKGFLYYLVEKQALAAGTSTPVSVSYRKADGKPSVAAQGAPAGSGQSDGRTMKNVLAFAAVLLVGVAGYALFFTSRRRDGDDYLDEIRARRRADRSTMPARFCTHCGQRVAGDDRFCGVCGHPRRATALQTAGS